MNSANGLMKGENLREKPRGVSIKMSELDPTDTPPRSADERGYGVQIRRFTVREKIAVDLIQRRLSTPRRPANRAEAVRYLLDKAADALGINGDGSGYSTDQRENELTQG